jgi:hypothetical protein
MEEYDIMKLAKAKEDSSDGLIPIFHHETRIDEEATEAAGKVIHKAVPYVEIIAPGNDKEKINRAVKEEDKERWPRQWQAFLDGRKEPEFDGMAITEWQLADKHIARTLRDSNIFTVEQLAAAADVNLQMLGPGILPLKHKAIKWLKNNEGKDDAIQEMKAKIAKLEEELQLQAETTTDVRVEFVVKNSGWYTYKGKKYREADLPPEVADALPKEAA